ncbi:large ribosomal subunit protein bL36m isoform X1 [Symphalangus syndactylus]|uniref:large ribosomal subunit protein bL36m isoform X1 n=1 Tax=Symphalangus syndactylus TaxID=9590 RepID=UPI0024418FC6|nr:39S ribosomal protein L36, mitochondrial isoform X1 [Symphalangus syndactylus]
MMKRGKGMRNKNARENLLKTERRPSKRGGQRQICPGADKLQRPTRCSPGQVEKVGAAMKRWGLQGARGGRSHVCNSPGHTEKGRRMELQIHHNMANLFIRKMVNPLLYLSRHTVKPRALSTFLFGSLRGAAPVAVEPRAEVRSLLSPGLLPHLLPALGFKNKRVLKKRCKDCYLVKRRGRWYVYCKTHPRHKQRQM